MTYQMTKRDDNVLVLSDQNTDRMMFQYNSQKMAALVAMIAIGWFLTIWFAGDQIKDTHVVFYWFLCFLAVAFGIGTITSIKTKIRLEIDIKDGVVNYFFSNLINSSEWRKSFGEFKEIRIYRPKVGQGAGRSSWLRILLKTMQGDEIPLGTGFFGIHGKEQARMLAEEISKAMSLIVIEEPSVESKR